MKSLQRLFSVLFIIALLFGLAACGEDQEPTDSQTNLPVSSDSDVQNESTNNDPTVGYVNPLTGLPADDNNANTRPIAIMINNIKQALPQEGVSDMDILMECLVEGSITRLMGICSDYESIDTVGSIRSARPYYLDFVQSFDALYCHVGGSAQATSEIKSRGIDDLDDISRDPLNIFYRDPERLKTMALEHTMMTTGEGLAKSVEHLKFRTAIREDYVSPFTFPEEGATVRVGTQEATHVYVPMSGYQKVDYVYDEAAKEYLRYQYDGQKHIDANNDKQLSFKNVILLFCDTKVIDSAGHLGITTTGTGDGYLISEGNYTAITWSKADRDGNLTLTDTATGKPIVINRGKTAINVCTLETESKINMNATDRAVNK